MGYVGPDGARLDRSQAFAGNQRPTNVPLTDAANVAIAALGANFFSLTATAGVGATRQLDNPSDAPGVGTAWILAFKQDGTGGRALTFDTYYDWGTEGAPDFSAQGADVYNVITFIVLSATKIRATTLLGA